MTTMYFFPKMCRKHLTPVPYELWQKFSSATKVVCPACNPDMGTTPIVVSDKYIALYPTETFSLKEGWVQRQFDDAREEVSKWPTWLRKARGV